MRAAFEIMTEGGMLVCFDGRHGEFGKNAMKEVNRCKLIESN